MFSLRRKYPKAFTKRLPRNDAALSAARRSFFKAVGNNFLILQLLFLALFCYIFGSLYQQSNHIHNLNIAFVDYDGGAIGHALRAAYASVQGEGFPSLIEQTPTAFLNQKDLYEAVCRTDFWASLYISPGSSARLASALSSSDDTTPYDPTAALSYIWNEARYAPVVDASISSPLIHLSNLARTIYTRNLSSLPPSTNLSILAEPWILQSLDIQPTPQGSRAIYNTIVIVLVLIQEFFYLGTINGLYAQFKLYSRVGPLRITVVRTINSIGYTFIGSLCVAGTIWAFKAGWDINGAQFVLAWISLWLFAHVNFLTLDVFTIWLPHPFVPMALISWVILNITSVILPFQLSPGFFQIGYIFPAHQIYQILVTIWSRGCGNQLKYALPVLFAWEIIGFCVSTLGVFKRCHFAMVSEQIQQREFKEKIDVAVQIALERLGREGRREKEEEKREVCGGRESEVTTQSDGSGGEDGDESNESLREELTQAMERVTTRQQSENKRKGVPCSFGPAFDLPFRKGSSVDGS